MSDLDQFTQVSAKVHTFFLFYRSEFPFNLANSKFNAPFRFIFNCSDGIGIFPKFLTFYIFSSSII